MTAPLEAPRSADDLYLARAAERFGVPVTRPIMTGDVFGNVQIPGVGDHDGDDQRLAIVVSHPCSMRQGAKVNDHVHMLRVLKHAPIPLEAWPKKYYRLMPLPDLTVIVDPEDVSADDPEAELAVRTSEGAHAAIFDLRGRVETSQLALESRIACLTEQGVAYLHQRMTHYDTRHAPEVEKLITTCTGIFAEIELWEQWNERLIPSSALSDPSELERELVRVGEQFDAILSQKRAIPGKKNGWYTLRTDLNQPKTHFAARREIHRILEDQSVATRQINEFDDASTGAV
jgi:hypothetical protein